MPGFNILLLSQKHLQIFPDDPKPLRLFPYSATSQSYGGVKINFETLVFVNSGILSMHKQLVILQRERQTWNLKKVLKCRGWSQVVHKLHIWILFSKARTQHGLVYHTVVCQQVWVLICQKSKSSLLLHYYCWSKTSSDGHTIIDIISLSLSICMITS